MDIIATQKYILSSPRKLRLVAGLVKGMFAKEAIEKLPFVGKRAYLPLKKVIATAVANARQRGMTDDTLLKIKEIEIGEGPRLKRWQAGARGRAKPYKRRMAHIRVVLTTRNDQVPNPKYQISTKNQKVKPEVEIKKKEKNDK